MVTVRVFILGLLGSNMAAAGAGVFGACGSESRWCSASQVYARCQSGVCGGASQSSRRCRCRAGACSARAVQEEPEPEPEPCKCQCRSRQETWYVQRSQGTS